MVYELSTEAKQDLDKIIEYTIEKHGVPQMFKYIDQIEQVAEELAAGFGHYKELKNIHPQLRVKKAQKHYIFGLMRGKNPMLILAIFHEQMDLMKRLKTRLAPE